MASKKRESQDVVEAVKKKRKVKETPATETPASALPSLSNDDVDFPRGGGTTLTPLEHQISRAEGLKEADESLVFKDAANQSRKRKRSKSTHRTDSALQKSSASSSPRIEQLNYKRITVGMKILGQVVSVRPLGLILSLPSKVFAHVPINNVSSIYTQLLEQEADFDEAQMSDHDKPDIPDITELFKPGDYVRGIVTKLIARGASEQSSFWKARDAMERASNQIELSLDPHQVNVGVAAKDLCIGFTLTAAVKSVEDHGYAIDMGIPNVTGFCSFKHVPKKLRCVSGQIVHAKVHKVTGSGRVCHLDLGPESLAKASISEINAVASVLPGEAVTALITGVQSGGLNVQLLGFFQGTIDISQLPDRDCSAFKVGQKLTARVLYDMPSTSPPQFALSLATHVMTFKVALADRSGMLHAIPIGTLMKSVEVLHVETELGLTVATNLSVPGFVHISQVSDEHVPSLSPSSGPWKVGSKHIARVVGHYAFDGVIQLSLKKSALEQIYMQASDLEVGQIVRGTVKSLTEKGLFLFLAHNLDGVVWPDHYADIPLKHPQKRFKDGSIVKCRVLRADSSRNRVVLTAKKSLVESELPIITNIDNVKVGNLTCGVVTTVLEKSVAIEFFGGVKGLVPRREISDSATSNLGVNFHPGKVIRVCIKSVDAEKGLVIASIKQAEDGGKAQVNVDLLQVGSETRGSVLEVHKDNVLLSLDPSNAPALLSIKSLAKEKNVPVAQLRSSLSTGEILDKLYIVSVNSDKGIAIVSLRDSAREPTSTKLGHSLTPGSTVSARVIRHGNQGVVLRLPSNYKGFLHLTDVSDDFKSSDASPTVGSTLTASVIYIDHDKREAVLSTRSSRMSSSLPSPVIDPEVQSPDDLQPGRTLRGFVKSIPEHGIFVSLGRDVVARIQIKELFDAYVKDWRSRFEINQIICGRILSIDPETKRVEMTLKNSSTLLSSSQLGDLKPGQKVDAVVRKTEDYGVFLQIRDTNISGLCHKSELSDNKEANLSAGLQAYQPGDQVRALIKAIDLGKNKISFSLKPSYFDESDFRQTVSQLDHSNGLDTTEKEGSSHKDDADDNTSSSDQLSVVDYQSHTVQNIPPRIYTNNSSAQPPADDISPLPLSQGFDWTSRAPAVNQIDLHSELHSESESESSTAPMKPKKKRRKIEYDLTGDLATKTLESDADFERTLLGSPNSSYIWIQYMSFHVQLSQLERAREIARRALSVINFREEEERLNVWMALLNLENTYGSEEELETVFNDAVKHNDAKTIHLRMATIFDRSGKPDKATELFGRTVKKFSHSCKVWTSFCEHHLILGNVEEARQLLPRSLQSLENRKHLKVISKFAQLEYKLGSPERAKTLFEGIVESHPKRWDLWSVYIDMESGQKDIGSVRSIFGRVLAARLSSHKAKFFFKKWLRLEEQHGDEEGVEMVKQRAIQWTQQAAQSS